MGNEVVQKPSYRFIEDFQSRDLSKSHCSGSFMNTCKGGQALSEFKSVVENYPNTPESREALGLAKIQYSELDQLSGYVDWIQTLTGSDIGQGQLDSTLYNGAYDRYSFGDCEGTIKGMKEYLTKFPDGIFRVPANYYLAECAFSLVKMNWRNL